MIKISLDEAAAYDLLSILEVKKYFCDAGPKKELIRSQIAQLQEEISQAVGYDLAKKIYCSDFYTFLYNANFDIFKLIEETKRNPAITLKRADELNYHRFTAKQNLQKEFFNKNLEEIKIGY